MKDRTFIFVSYEGFRQSQEASGTINVPDATERALAVPAIQPYLALWPVAPATAPDVNGIQTFNVNVATIANENNFITRFDHRISNSDSLDGQLLLRLRTTVASGSVGKHGPSGFLAQADGQFRRDSHLQPAIG